ncbi:hypothetical protein [Actinoplanes sp. TFC3]|uniref:hypothetical protein n=1 Tax=Actinoplanes sp. TFC3 TaxID=1710355 RepID=UPI001F3621A8|nr:hypothetical protein [Actinoplanes sp. TFC3]
MTAAAAGVTATSVVKKRRASAQDHDGRPHVITVFRPYDELKAEQVPGSLAELGDTVEVSLRPAPADRGTEISVRPRDGSPVGAGDIRRALRETRSLLEAGDVLLPSGPPTTKTTLLNRPLQAATEHGREGGLL